MPLNLSFITSKEEFIDYFIYYYEYTFLIDDIENIEVKKELIKIVETTKINNYKDLWIYTYLKFTNILLKEYPLDYLKDTIEKLAKDFLFIDDCILEIQLELIKNILNEIEAVTLEIRPYEQLKLSSNYGNYLLKKEKDLTKFFEENICYFSETSVNKISYVKVKKQRYISFSTILFELYSVILFELIESDIVNNLDISCIEKKLKEFLNGFKNGKLNKDLFNELKNKTITFLMEYIGSKN